MGTYSVADLKRIFHAKSENLIRLLLCLPEYEKKRVYNHHAGKRLMYGLDAMDLKALRLRYTERLIRTGRYKHV